jgi:hypothetical protein
VFAVEAEFVRPGIGEISSASCEAVTDTASAPSVQPLPCEIDAAANTRKEDQVVRDVPAEPLLRALSKKWILSPRPPTVNIAPSTPQAGEVPCT